MQCFDQFVEKQRAQSVFARIFPHASVLFLLTFSSEDYEDVIKRITELIKQEGDSMDNKVRNFHFITSQRNMFRFAISSGSVERMKVENSYPFVLTVLLLK